MPKQRKKKVVLKKIYFILIAILLIALLLIFFEGNQPNEYTSQDKNESSELYHKSPDFEAYFLNGTKFSMHDLRGQPVILNFWATWCPPCRREMPNFEKVFKEGKIVVIGINLNENPERVKKYLNKFNITFPVVIDTQDKIQQKYSALLKPTTYFIDKNGIIVDKKYGELSGKELEERSQKLLR